MDYKKKYLKYKKKYLEIKKMRGGMDQFFNFSTEGPKEQRKIALRKEERDRQKKHGVAVKGSQPDIDQASQGILNLSMLQEFQKEQQLKENKKTPAVLKTHEKVLKWPGLARKSEHVFNNIEDCQTEVERLQELLKKKERDDELTPPKR